MKEKLDIRADYNENKACSYFCISVGFMVDRGLSKSVWAQQGYAAAGGCRRLEGV
jgi:hypothetical protein